MAEIAKHLKRLRPHAAIVAASVTLGLVFALLLESVAGMAKLLWFSGATWWWISTDVLRPHTPLAWQSAIVLAGVLAWWIARPASHGARARALWSVLTGVLALVLVTEVVLRPEPAPLQPSPIPWAFVLVFGAGVASASWLARRSPKSTRGGNLASSLGSSLGPGRRIAAAVLLAVLSQVPSITDWIEEHESQSFPRFRLELVAAHAVADPVLDRDHAWAEGLVWSLDDTDALVITDAEVERVRWVVDPEDGRPGLTIRFDAATAQAVRARSVRRVGEFDAIVIDGKTHMVPSIQAVLLDGALALHVPVSDRGRLAELYERLTGRAAPNR